uniref:C2H2-type domain-containing protein n=1 Tax=Cacopsylla melanoneura TaxID=428564 RepID=A0A8D9EZI3_9HEMI
MKSVKCDFCGGCYNTNAEWSEHFQKVHLTLCVGKLDSGGDQVRKVLDDVTNFECYKSTTTVKIIDFDPVVCIDRLACDNIVNKKIKTKASGKLESCNFCVFRSKNIAEHTIRNHSNNGRRLIYCEICNRVYSRRSALKWHVQCSGTHRRKEESVLGQFEKLNFLLDKDTSPFDGFPCDTDSLNNDIAVKFPEKIKS